MYYPVFKIFRIYLYLDVLDYTIIALVKVIDFLNKLVVKDHFTICEFDMKFNKHANLKTLETDVFLIEYIV